MWNEFLKISLHDPIIWFAVLVAILIVFGLRAQARRRRLIEQFAVGRGYTFQRVLESRALRLSDTDFFRRLDRATNAVSGNLDGAQFILFDHEAHRGKYSSFTQTMVAFEIGPSTSFRPTTLGSYGFEMEKTASHVFLWQERRCVPLDDLEPFLHSALNVFQQATS
jgi:hypothetical protein